jgi:hypothetical protein
MAVLLDFGVRHYGIALRLVPTAALTDPGVGGSDLRVVVTDCLGWCDVCPGAVPTIYVDWYCPHWSRASRYRPPLEPTTCSYVAVFHWSTMFSLNSKLVVF